MTSMDKGILQLTGILLIFGGALVGAFSSNVVTVWVCVAVAWAGMFMTWWAGRRNRPSE